MDSEVRTANLTTGSWRSDRTKNVTCRRDASSSSRLLPCNKIHEDSMASADSLKDVVQHTFPPTHEDALRQSDVPEASPSGATTPTSSRPASTNTVTAALPPVDTGYAWIFLAAGFAIGTSYPLHRQWHVKHRSVCRRASLSTPACRRGYSSWATSTLWEERTIYPSLTRLIQRHSLSDSPSQSVFSTNTGLLCYFQTQAPHQQSLSPRLCAVVSCT